MKQCSPSKTTLVLATIAGGMSYVAFQYWRADQTEERGFRAFHAAVQDDADGMHVLYNQEHPYLVNKVTIDLCYRIKLRLGANPVDNAANRMAAHREALDVIRRQGDEEAVALKSYQAKLRAMDESLSADRTTKACDDGHSTSHDVVEEPQRPPTTWTDMRYTNQKAIVTHAVNMVFTPDLEEIMAMRIQQSIGWRQRQRLRAGRRLLGTLKDFLVRLLL